MKNLVSRTLMVVLTVGLLTGCTKQLAPALGEAACHYAGGRKTLQ